MERVTSKDRRRMSPRRIGVAQAKAKLSEALRDVGLGPTVIHNRGRDVAVLVDVAEYERLLAESGERPSGGARFLQRVDELKRELGGGVEGFDPPPASFTPQVPFRRARRSRGR